MTAKPACFADLIAPTDTERFLGESWEAKPLHIRRGNPAYYAGLPAPAEIDAMIAAGNLRYPAIQLAKGGAFFPAEIFTRTIKYGSDPFTGLVDIDKVRSEYRAGATISLPGFHRASKRVGDLTAVLESALDHAVHANVYITPANAAGFTPHYDTHETFILQLGGHKHWRIYEPPIVLPHRSQPFSPQTYTLPAAPIMEVDLETGDLLYLPRGYVHTTATSGSFSTHMTIGIAVYTWIELISHLLQSSTRDTEFRKALPPGFASDAAASSDLKQELIRLLALLTDKTEYNGSLESFSQRVKAARFRTGGTFKSDVR